jgi:ferric-dicitrate binding protein FerR (iron transport regulator)
MDSSFVAYAQGETKNSVYWNGWIASHKEEKEQIDEALLVARTMQFRSQKSSSFLLNQKWDTLKHKLQDMDQLKLKRYLKVWKYAASILILISLGLGSLFLVQTKRLNDFNQMASNEMVIKTSTGAPSHLLLPDGTEVWINSSSTLKYPSVFSENQRDVQLEGEAFFHVTKNHVPFVVHAPKCNVKVYGTQFNVDAYSDQERSIVALKEGSISISGENIKEHFLKPGMIAEIDNSSNVQINKVTKVDDYADWMDGKQSFKGRPLKEITDRLGRKFGVRFVYKDPKAAQYTYNLSFSTESLKEILELLEFTAPLHFERETDDHNQINVISK